MKEEAIRRINKLGHAGQIIANICKVLLIIGAALLLLSAGLLAAIPKGAVTLSTADAMDINVNVPVFTGWMGGNWQQELLSAGDLNLTLEGQPAEIERTDTGFRIVTRDQGQTLDLHRLSYRLLLLVLLLAAVTVTMFLAASLCKSLRYCQTPFSEDIVSKLRRVAWSLIPWAVLSWSADPAYLLRGNLSLGIDLKTVLLILIILALAFVFRYGAMLQKESDETL